MQGCKHFNNLNRSCYLLLLVNIRKCIPGSTMLTPPKPRVTMVGRVECSLQKIYSSSTSNVFIITIDDFNALFLKKKMYQFYMSPTYSIHNRVHHSLSLLPVSTGYLIQGLSKPKTGQIYTHTLLYCCICTKLLRMS